MGINTRETLKINQNGHLEIGKADAVSLAKQFGTPLYVMDEAHIRKMCRAYKRAFAESYGNNGMALYASKAFSCLAIYKIMAQEGIGIDVVSGGELFTALQAGFPAENIYMHGNNKLPSELNLALDSGIGTIVADSYSEIDMLEELCAQKQVTQKILLRINPGVEAHTHHYIQTAKTDSKFGFSIADGTAEKITEYALGKTHLRLEGYHCHIGSQIHENVSFVAAVKKMFGFIDEVKTKFSFIPTVLNLGGGYGIWYTDEDTKRSYDDYTEFLKNVFETVKEQAKKINIDAPYVLIEPGRSIVGEAGITLYTVGAIKEIPAVKKYVAVDGGMFDNPRFALYQAKYTAILANRANESATEVVSIAGKCCESGDILCANVELPKARRGDILAVLSTGAYNFSMASNYNRNLVPPVVLVKDGKAEYIVKPQTFEDLIRNDVIPDSLK